jgi:hypothetical protein
MLLIRPKSFADGTAALSASNISEGTLTAWNSGTTYAAGDRSAVITGTSIQVYKSLVDGNLNNNPASTSGYWALDGKTYLEYSAATRYALGDRVVDSGLHRIYESLSGGTSSVVTITLASPGVVSWTAHGLAANTPILFETTGTLPTGLTPGTIYYVLAPTANAFNVSATAGGAAINTSVSQSGTHTAIANPNKGYSPSSAAGLAFWLDVAPTNKWAMFDSYNATQTVHPFLIDVSVAVTGRIDSLALLNLSNAISARVIVSTISDGVVFDQTFSLISTAGITTMYDYFFEDVTRSDTLYVGDLPTYIDPTIRVVIEGDGTQVGCGIFSVGLSKDLGATLHDGAQVGITDYSRKDADEFGNFVIVQRSFAKRGSFQMRIDKAAVDGIQAVLSDFRTVPAVYLAAAEYGATLIFGFFRDFNIEIDRDTESLVSIELEGLT